MTNIEPAFDRFRGCYVLYTILYVWFSMEMYNDILYILIHYNDV